MDPLLKQFIRDLIEEVDDLQYSVDGEYSTNLELSDQQKEARKSILLGRLDEFDQVTAVEEGGRKPILDACCGSRMFWFDKKNPNVVFADIRYEDLDLNHGNRTCHIRPDKIQDFRKMDFADESFHLVVFDPPHLKGAGKNGYMAKKYGSLDKNWRADLKAGFDECMRVLKLNGTLIFKWNEHSIKVSEVIKVFGSEPLFGHRTLQTSKTIWMAFMKGVS